MAIIIKITIDSSRIITSASTEKLAESQGIARKKL